MKAWEKLQEVMAYKTSAVTKRITSSKKHYRINGVRSIALYLENVFEAFKGDSYDLGVVDLKEIRQRRDAAFRDEVFDLLGFTATSSVRNCPRSFLQSW